MTSVIRWRLRLTRATWPHRDDELLELVLNQEGVGEEDRGLGELDPLECADYLTTLAAG
ncbi:MAG: hypothetical protein QOG15_3717 [Solirubrobacteraceae bacterium]|jgi:hypothetical protein|nr:hypothetical protein [Solirubrobacteraceae bacterium]